MFEIVRTGHPRSINLVHNSCNTLFYSFSWERLGNSERLIRKRNNIRTEPSVHTSTELLYNKVIKLQDCHILGSAYSEI